MLLTLTLSAIFVPGFAGVTDDPVIMSVDGKEFKKSEFEYIYNKNIRQQIEKRSLDEYVDMFRDYKLKVMEAEACGIDTTEAFIKEFTGYRNQLAEPYLKDSAVEDSLVAEAYDRLKTDVEVAHILLTVDGKLPGKGEEEVYKKAKSIVTEIRGGKSFEELAAKFSDDRSTADNGGYIGFIRGFMTVLPFEDAAYATKTGEVSEPALSRYGYHIVKVISRRPNPGEIRTAHIMLKLPAGAPENIRQLKRDSIFGIYERIVAGADFAEMAEKYSEDSESSKRGGLMPWLSSGRIVKEYEDVAFALKEAGDVSEPFLSPYGWHIVKLVEKRGVKPLADLRRDIIRRISRDERAGAARKALVEKLKGEYGYSFNGPNMEKLESVAVSYRPDDTRFADRIADSDDVIFSFAGKDFTAADFAGFLSGHRASQATGSNIEMLMERMEAFIDYSILTYEDSRLEEKYPDFKNLVNEYHDGILLFDISTRMVWDKASKDVKGLKKYFRRHKRDYAWESPRFKGYAVECMDDSIAGLVGKRLDELSGDSAVYEIYREFNGNGVKRVNIKKGLFACGDNGIVDCCVFGIGDKPADKTLPVVFTRGKLLKKGPECYTDVRGRVISDYQDELEKEWVKDLNKKYDVVIYDDVVETIKEQ